MTKTIRSVTEVFRYLAWEYDIAHAREIISEQGLKPEGVLRVADVAKMLPHDPAVEPRRDRLVFGAIGVDWDRVEALSEDALTEPLIVAQAPRSKDAPDEGTHLVIDGWHRLAKARRLGVETLPAFVLNLAQTEEIMTGRSNPIVPEPDPEFTPTARVTIEAWFDWKPVQELIGDASRTWVVEEAFEALSEEADIPFEPDERQRLLSALHFKVR